MLKKILLSLPIFFLGVQSLGSQVIQNSEAKQLSIDIFNRKFSRKDVIQRFYNGDIKATLHVEEFQNIGKRVVFTFRDGSRMLNTVFDDKEMQAILSSFNSIKYLEDLQAILRGDQTKKLANFTQADLLEYSLNHGALTKKDFGEHIVQHHVNIRIRPVMNELGKIKIKYTMTDGSEFTTDPWSKEEVMSIPKFTEILGLAHVLSGISPWEFTGVKF